MRYAIYFMPVKGNTLVDVAHQWVGRDAYRDEAVNHPIIADMSATEIAYHTASARRYGFHGTLKAPFRLSSGETEASLLSSFERFCAAVEPFEIPHLAIAQLDAFFALIPEQPVPALDSLANAVVETFDRFRAPLTEAEVARRNPESLKLSQLKNLYRWGYPYVKDDFRFHMTLTGRVGSSDAERVKHVLHRVFDDALRAPVPVSALTLCVEPERGAPFEIHTQKPLGRASALKTA